MAKQGGVKLTVTGLPAGTASGVTITYQVGSVPSATVDLIPPGGYKVGGGSGGFGNIDQMKRKEDITIDISVETYAGFAGMSTRKLKFVGLLDGLSMSNAVGTNRYQAVLKNKAQRLLELTTHTPGLYPAGINIYRNPNYAVLNVQGEDGGKANAWENLVQKTDLKPDLPMIKYYTGLMRVLLKTQQSEWETFVGTETLPNGKKAFEEIFTDPRYQKALNSAIELFSEQNVDLSAVSGGVIDDTSSSINYIQEKMPSIFKEGSNILLENYLDFLNYLGCSLIFSNSKMYVVPINSVLKQPAAKPGKYQLQTTPNHAGPSDYQSYNYNDNGYRDIGCVVLSTSMAVGGAEVGQLTYERGYLTQFSEDKGQSQASGVLVVEQHPLMQFVTTAPKPSDSPDNNKSMDQESESLCDDGSFDSEQQQAKEATVQRQQEQKEEYKADEEKLKNFAETKFYQARYNDRNGSITMDFNPDWVPGTGGTLYVRETDTVISFYVNSVTHTIDYSPPNQGNAMTVVSFNCGRIANEAIGVSEDSFLGYNIGKEQAIQKAFIEDNS